MGKRVSFVALTDVERDKFLAAVLGLKNKIANPTDPVNERVSVYDQFVAIHGTVMRLTMPDGISRNFGHRNSMFLPWHRLYIKEFESELQEIDPTVTLPYWDWTARSQTGSRLFQDDFIGPVYSQPRVVASGYFAQNAPSPEPIWWPAGLEGWFIREELQPYLAQLPDGSMPGESDLRGSLVRGGGDTADFASRSVINSLINQSDYSSFRLALEAGVFSGANGSPTHNFGHNWVGGHMGTGTSPNDPIFFMHHCFVDKIWADWQANGHEGEDNYIGSSPFGLNDPLWPWVTNPEDYDPPGHLSHLIPEYDVAESFTPADVLDISTALLDYSYE